MNDEELPTPPQLRPWLQFLTESTHVLKHHPELVWQEAANQPQQTAVARRVRELRGAGRWLERCWFEWLNGAERATGRLMTLTGHTDAIMALAVTPDGSRIISAGQDGTIRIWSSRDGQETHRLQGHTGPVSGLAMSPDGRWFVSAGADMLLLVWDLHSGEEIRMIAGNHRAIRSVAAFHSHPWIACGTEDGKVNVFAVDEGTRLFTLTGHTQSVRSLVVSPDDRWIISGSEDKTIRIWDVAARKPNGALKGHKAGVHAVAVTPDGRHLVSAGHDELVLLWDWSRGKKLRTWRSPSDPVFALAPTPDGQWILGGTRSGYIKIWQLFGGREEQQVRPHTDPIYALVVQGSRIHSAGGDALAITNDCTVKVLDQGIIGAGGLAAGHLADVKTLAFSPDGQALISGSVDGTLRIWEAEGNRVIRVLAHGGEIGAMALTADSRTIVSGSREPWTRTNSIRIWDAAAGRARRKLVIAADRVTALAVSADGDRIVAGIAGSDFSSLVKIWNARGRLLHVLSGHQGDISGLALAGRQVISVSSGRMVHAAPRSRFDLGGLRMWDLETGTAGLAFPSPHLGFIALALSPDGDRLALVVSDGTIGVWRVGDERPVRMLGEPLLRDRNPGWDALIPERTPERVQRQQRIPSAVAFTSDGQMLVTGDAAGLLTLWDMPTGKSLAHYVAPASIHSIATRNDLIAVGTSGGGIFVLRIHGIGGLRTHVSVPPEPTRFKWLGWRR